MTVGDLLLFFVFAAHVRQLRPVLRRRAVGVAVRQDRRRPHLRAHRLRQAGRRSPAGRRCPRTARASCCEEAVVRINDHPVVGPLSTHRRARASSSSWPARPGRARPPSPGSSPAVAAPTEGSVTLDGVDIAEADPVGAAARGPGGGRGPVPVRPDASARTCSSAPRAAPPTPMLWAALDAAGARQVVEELPHGPRHRPRRPRPHRLGRPAPAPRARLRPRGPAAGARARRRAVGRRPRARGGDPPAPPAARARAPRSSPSPAGRARPPSPTGSSSCRRAAAGAPKRPRATGQPRHRRALRPAARRDRRPAPGRTATSRSTTGAEAEADEVPAGAPRSSARSAGTCGWPGLLLLGFTFVGLVPTWMTQVALDAVGARGRRPGRSSPASSRCVAAVVVAVLTYAFRVEAKKVEEGVGYVLRRRAFARLMRLGVDFYDRELPGRVAARVVHDLDQIAIFLETGVYDLAVVDHPARRQLRRDHGVGAVGRAVRRRRGPAPGDPHRRADAPGRPRLPRRSGWRSATWSTRLQEDFAGRHVIEAAGAEEESRERFVRLAFVLRQARKRAQTIANTYIEVMTLDRARWPAPRSINTAGRRACSTATLSVGGHGGAAAVPHRRAGADPAPVDGAPALPRGPGQLPHAGRAVRGARPARGAAPR